MRVQKARVGLVGMAVLALVLGGARQAEGSLLLLSSIDDIIGGTVIDFDDSHGLLDTQFAGEGVVFGNSGGFLTDTNISTGFARPLSGPVVLPGAPTGITGAKFTFLDPVHAIGFDLRLGAIFPFDAPGFPVDGPTQFTLRLSDPDGNVLGAFDIFSPITDQGPGKFPLDGGPFFVGVGSTADMPVGMAELTIQRASFYQFDNLRFSMDLPGPVIPEPGSLLLFGSGLLGLASTRRHRRRT